MHPIDTFVTCTQASNPALPAEVSVPAQKIALHTMERALLPCGYQQAIRVLDAIMESGNTTLVDAMLVWMDERPDWLDGLIRSYHREDSLRGYRAGLPITTDWNGPVHPNAARLWMRVTHKDTVTHAKAIYDVVVKTSDRNTYARKGVRDSILASLLAISNTPPDFPLAEKIAKVTLQYRAHHAWWNKRDVLAYLLSGTAGIDAVIAAYGAQKTRASWFILALSTPPAFLSKAIHAHGMPGQKGTMTAHRSMKIVSALPERARLEAILAARTDHHDNTDVKAAWHLLEQDLAGTLDGKKPHKRGRRTAADAHTPEAVAKRAARAAKRAALAQQDAHGGIHATTDAPLGAP